MEGSDILTMSLSIQIIAAMFFDVLLFTRFTKEPLQTQKCTLSYRHHVKIVCYTTAMLVHDWDLAALTLLTGDATGKTQSMVCCQEETLQSLPLYCMYILWVDRLVYEAAKNIHPIYIICTDCQICYIAASR